MPIKTIDVIVPVYNGMPYVEKTILGVINQTLKPTCILVVNDGSTDETLKTVERLAATHPQIKIKVITQKNGGHSSATNQGIRESTSEFIALVDADDLWHPSKLEKQMSVFENSTDHKLGVVYTDYINIDVNDQPLPEFRSVKLDQTFKGNVFELLIRKGNQIMGSNSAVLMKRQVFLDHGFFDENLRCGEDWEMWIRIARTYHYDYYPEILTYIRRHDRNLSNQKMLHCLSDLYIMNKWKNDFLKLNGPSFTVDYLSRITFTNQKNILINPQYKYLIATIKEMTQKNSIVIIIFTAFMKKILNKILRTLKSRTSKIIPLHIFP